ncbi:Suppressor of SWI4 1-like protein [Hypsibius exemplaris]|uniref:Suppressor of SWI4 1-like protein n=1 Tax=Hypsibius exemplaris TaxID=2072580 RepID=A0A1W0WY04_HYPEX|nr:Suppressor of SWI4 1-like protein [Hypsibius exemplaris]
MAKKKKGRATKSAKAKSAVESEEISRAPHTFVIKRGAVGKDVNHLMIDMRKVMEPYTASQLKVGKQNVLKDFVAVAGPLHVSHMISFSKSDAAPHMRIMRLPRGPTLTLRVQQYSLMRDVVSSLKKPQNHPKQFDHPPLLVLNNFQDRMEHRLVTTMLQSMYPSLNVTKLKLKQVYRCVLFNYNVETDRVEFRHYNIKAKPHGLSRPMQKLMKSQVPNMSGLQSIDELFTQAGNASESEMEDDPDNKVSLPQPISSRGNMANQLSSIRLTELGPRLTLELIKIEDGICDGEVLYHSTIHKTEEEIKDLRRARLLRQTRKNDLRMEQERNVERKQQSFQAHREDCWQGTKRKFGSADGPREEPDSEDDGYVEKDRVSDDDDEAWYEEEVGERPEPGILSRGGFGFRRGGMMMRGRGRGRFSGRRGGGGGRGGYGGRDRDDSGGDRPAWKDGGDRGGFRGARGGSRDRGGSSRGFRGGRGGDRGPSRGSFRGGGSSRGFRGRGDGGSRGGSGGDRRGGGRGMHRAISFRKKVSSR